MENFLNQLTVMSLLALYLLEVRGQRGPIVKTFTSSTMLNRLGEQFNVPVHETPVGFKFVAPKMLETDALLGGEESGGYAFRGHVPERDGILAGLSSCWTTWCSPAARRLSSWSTSLAW